MENKYLTKLEKNEQEKLLKSTRIKWPTCKRKENFQKVQTAKEKVQSPIQSQVLNTTGIKLSLDHYHQENERMTSTSLIFR